MEESISLENIRRNRNSSSEKIHSSGSLFILISLTSLIVSIYPCLYGASDAGLHKNSDASPTDDETQEIIEVDPEDKFYLVHLMVLLLGIMHLLPTSFFVTANDYWMYKFRNTSSIDMKDRSELQSNFASGSNIATSVPTVICMVLSTVFGYKSKLRTRIITSLSIVAASLMLSTVFIVVDTDGWQTEFFALMMMILALMNGIMALFQVSTLALINKLPPAYLKTFLVGQGVGGIFISALQVLSLVVGTSSNDSALVYFISGTLITSSTLALFYNSKHLNFYVHHYGKNPEDTNKDVISFQEVTNVSRKIWSSLVIGIAGALAYAPTHPAVAALVVSEYHGSGYSWNGKMGTREDFGSAESN